MQNTFSHVEESRNSSGENRITQVTDTNADEYLKSKDQRWGLGEAPKHPKASSGIQIIDTTWSPQRLSFALIRANAVRVSIAALLLIIFGVSTMLVPTVVGKFVDEVATPAYHGIDLMDLRDSVLFWVGALALLYAASNVGYRFGSRIGWLGVQQGQFELSQAVIRRVLSSKGFEDPQRPPGQLLSIATGDAQRACLALYIVVYPPGQIVALCVAALTLANINLWLGLGVVLVLPALMFFMHWAAQPLQRRSLKEQSSLADAAAGAADLVSGVRVLSGLHAEAVAVQGYRELSRTALSQTIKARTARAAYEGLSTSGAQLIAVLVALASAILAFYGVITPGDLITTTGVAVIMINPINELVSTLGSKWAVAQASSQRLLELLRTNPHPATSGTSDLPEKLTGVAFNNVNLGSEVIDVDLCADEFVVLDISKESSSRLSKILGLQAFPESGEVHISGLSLAEIAPGSLRKQVLVLPHKPGLLAGTIWENVCALGPQQASAEVALQALDVAFLREQELALGFDTQISDGAWQLSGGQRQRIALARAIAADPTVLVLIEPTTSVDSVTEARIATRLREHRRGKLTVVITQAPVFHSIADRVIHGFESRLS